MAAGALWLYSGGSGLAVLRTSPGVTHTVAELFSKSSVCTGDNS